MIYMTILFILKILSNFARWTQTCRMTSQEHHPF
jgi:hypothetical protein